MLLCLLLLLTIGVGIGNSFGESWDEHSAYLYGEASLDAYARKLQGIDLVPKNYGPFDIRFYGPAYLVIGTVASSLLKALLPNWSPIDVWHLINYGTFLIGAIFLYKLGKIFLRPGIALISTLLFVTQPLLFGHAFINAKDIPFMVLTIISVTTCLSMGDALFKRSVESKTIKQSLNLKGVKIFIDEWNDKMKAARFKFFGVSGLMIVILAIFFLTKPFAFHAIEQIVNFLYHATPSSLSGKIFKIFAQRAGLVDLFSYVIKAQTLYSRILLNLLLLAPFLILFAFFRLFPRTWKNIRLRYVKPLLFWIKETFPRELVIASLFSGLCLSIRILGLFVLGLVSIYLLFVLRIRAIRFISAYLLLSCLFTYLAWPFLWGHPIESFAESIHYFSTYEFYTGVLFAGKIYGSNMMPPYYFPTLLALQLTLPVVLLSLIGPVLIMKKLFASLKENIKLLVLLAWFLIPFIAVVIFRPIMYDNFRHYLFILPPVFIFAGFTIENIFKKITQKDWQFALIAIFLIPGVFSIIHLHPYEYIFYNSLIGGVRGAQGLFETDYWALSYRDAAEFLNEYAPPEADIAVWGPVPPVRNRVRPGLTVLPYPGETQGLSDGVEFAVIFTRYNTHLLLYPDARVVYRVEKDGVLLAVVKDLRDQ
jgi:hypothetical protein